MLDPTEAIRREMLPVVNAPAVAAIKAAADDPSVDPKARLRAELEASYGQVWDATQVTVDFEVLGFRAPLVVVRRRADGKRGSMEFTHSPRLYYGFIPEN
jgi:hypothetical protein